MTRRIIAVLGTAAVTLLAGVSPAAAAGGFTLFGDATLTGGHNSPTGVQIRSSVDVPPGFGGIEFAVPAGTTFADIQTLATDYMFTAGSCGGGAPRFSIETPSGNAFVYLGPPPNYTDCPQDIWANTGNLATPASFVDTSQLGGTFYDTFATADARFGSLAVTGIALVVDADWKFGTQTAVVDNVQINGTTYTFESAASCKDGGWQSFSSAPGPFKNQGDCVSFFAGGGKNTAG
jgi:hypothetical protein